MTRRTFPAVLCLLLAFWGAGFAGPGGSGNSADASGRGPELNAKAWIVIDARTGEPLAGHAVNRHLPMASTTKLMTAYLAVRNLPFRANVVAGRYDADPAESLMGLKPGQVVSVRDLVHGLLMVSGNDAAVTLAIAVSGTVPRFVRLMNRTARELGLNDTSYENPVGLDGPRHYTSAADLARLGRIVMNMPRLRKIAGAREAVLTSYRPPVTIRTNDSFLLENNWAHGIKTGHTLSSGYTLASDGRKKATELIGAVIGAPTEAARNQETVRLLNWGFSLYSKEVPIRVGAPVATIEVRYEDDDLPVRSKRRVRLGVRDGERLAVSTDLPEEVEGPVAAGERMGAATVLLNGEPYATVPLFAGRAIDAPTLADRMLESPLVLIGLLVLLLFAIIVVLRTVRRRRERNARRRIQRVLRQRQ